MEVTIDTAGGIEAGRAQEWADGLTKVYPSPPSEEEMRII